MNVNRNVNQETLIEVKDLRKVFGKNEVGLTRHLEDGVLLIQDGLVCFIFHDPFSSSLIPCSL